MIPASSRVASTTLDAGARSTGVSMRSTGRRVRGGVGPAGMGVPVAGVDGVREDDAAEVLLLLMEPRLRSQGNAAVASVGDREVRALDSVNPGLVVECTAAVWPSPRAGRGS